MDREHRIKKVCDLYEKMTEAEKREYIRRLVKEFPVHALALIEDLLFDRVR
jgi:hypothetical protein